MQDSNLEAAEALKKCNPSQHATQQLVSDLNIQVSLVYAVSLLITVELVEKDSLHSTN